MPISAPPDAGRAKRLLHALMPLSDAGLSVHALTAKFDSSIVEAIRAHLRPDEFNRISAGARAPQNHSDWAAIYHAAEAVTKVLADAVPRLQGP